MQSCSEQMLEMEQSDELYPVGRALRSAFRAWTRDGSAGDDCALLARIEAAEAAK